MRKMVAGMLVVGFVAATVSPASAQFIDWSRRQNKDGAAAPAPAPRTRAVQQAPAPRAQMTQNVETRGTIIQIDKRMNQIVIRDAVDGLRKTFNVDPQTMATLSRYDEVAITHRQGSDIAVSVTVM